MIVDSFAVGVTCFVANSVGYLLSCRNRWAVEQGVLISVAESIISISPVSIMVFLNKAGDVESGEGFSFT